MCQSKPISFNNLESAILKRHMSRLKELGEQLSADEYFMFSDWIEAEIENLEQTVGAHQLRTKRFYLDFLNYCFET